jgi:hypothetical protein
MGVAPEVSLVVKHTFLEYIRTPDAKSRRARSFSDTELFECGGKDDASAVLVAPDTIAESIAGDSTGGSSSHKDDSSGALSGGAAQPADQRNALNSTEANVAWPVTPVLEAVFEPETLTERGELVDLEATMEVKAVLGMAAGASPCQDAQPEPTVQPPHQWLPPAAMQMLECEDHQMQDAMLFQHPWVFVPYADFGDCCHMQGEWALTPSGDLGQAQCWADGGLWQPDAALEDASTASISSGATPSAGDISSYETLSTTETRTTVMLRNLPNTLTRERLLRVLEAMGFAGQYDLVYIPVDFSTGAGLGYAFINMISSTHVPRLWDMFDGFSQWGTGNDKVCTVSWSDPHQGLAAHVERYQNSPVMHPDVPDEWKPALFVHGVRVEFPPPTRKLKAPKVRSKKLEGA